MAGRMTAVDIGSGHSGGQQAVTIHEMKSLVPFFLPFEVGAHGDVPAPFEELLDLGVPLHLIKERASHQNH